MNISIKNPLKTECFTTIFQHIKLFSDHINIMFEKERMYLQAMDGSRVSIFEVFIPSTWFDEYNHSNETNICIGLSSTTFFKILNTHEKQQTMNFVFDNNESDKLYINYTCDNKNIFDKHFEIPLMDIDTDVMQIPLFESQADIVLPSSNFASLINQLKLFGDTININCNEEKILLNSSTEESGKMSVEIKIEDVDSYSINEGQQLNLSYSLSYLHNICQYNKLAKDIEIKITENYPIKITYNLLDDAKIIYYLAPKIED